MKIAVLYEVYNGKGMNQISIAGEYLNYDRPDFGSAIEELYITMHFKQHGPAKGKGFEQMYENFHESLSRLPKCTFYRKKKTLELDIEASFATGVDVSQSNKSLSINPIWIKAALESINNNLPIIEAKLKASDDFDFHAFESYCKEKTDNVPVNESELKEIEQTAAKNRDAAKAGKDEWEALDICWDDYHPDAKNIMNHAYQWSSDDEFSPHGGDTGADVLSSFAAWNQKTNLNPRLFLHKVLAAWEVDPKSPYDSEYTSKVYFESVVALAFAACKFRGVCDPELRDMAVSAVDKHILALQDISDWEFKEECITKWRTSRDTLKGMPTL